MVARNSIPKVESKLYAKKMDEWILSLKHNGVNSKNIAELDQLPGDYFLKVLNHQEFQTLILLLPFIHDHLDLLITCLARKFAEQNSEERHDIIDMILLHTRRGDLTDEQKAVWRQVYEAIVPARFRKAA